MRRALHIEIMAFVFTNTAHTKWWCVIKWQQAAGLAQHYEIISNLKAISLSWHDTMPMSMIHLSIISIDHHLLSSDCWMLIESECINRSYTRVFDLWWFWLCTRDFDLSLPVKHTITQITYPVVLVADLSQCSDAGVARWLMIEVAW